MALSTRLRNFIHLVPVVAAAVPLAACNQTMPVANKSDLSAANREASLEGGRPMMRRRVAIRTIKHTPYKRTAQIPPTSYGIASFYSDDQLTANGEKFNPKAMTAAHPTLPFGTRLRVTNLATGRFVTVRINDRGPYVHGRVVDVSVSAAESLGIVDRGIAKVKLDVIN
ncbi:MAG: septal ring lytic transglycosylase RlpA family protein [Pseudolabrys sp.]